MKKTMMAVLGLWLAFGTPVEAALLFNTNATWQYFKGRSEASTPDATAWRHISFNDAAFTLTSAPFWYGDAFPSGTQLTDMLNQYTCIFMRRTFVITNLSEISALRLGSRCDDGFIAWINGVEVQRYNVPAGDRAFNAVAGPAVTEPVPFNFVDLVNPENYLVLGTNVVAVQAFNASVGSSDLIMDLSLSTTAPDFVPPSVAPINPPAGTVSGLTQISVTFSEPVSGVNASDLLINGLPAASMTGGNDLYTFTFAQPAYGPVQITWTAAHGIADFAIPPNPFNATAPGATWQYTLVDNTPPALTFQLPFAGVTVRTLTQIEVNFSEAVAGVNAADLLINGTPATNVVTLQPSQFLFRFPQPPVGSVSVTWAAGHGIQDFAAVPNSFAGGSWTYTLDPNAVVSAVRINEIGAANVSGLRDEDNEQQDWIELFNTSSNAVSLAGWSLTDNEDEPTQWVFPPVALGARSYLIVFCSGKDRKPTAPGSRLHTNFRLSPEGEYLALYNAEVPRQAVSVFSPYPNQRTDYSFGYDPTDQLRYFQTPTPGAVNGASSITGIVGDTKFSHDRGFYTNGFSLSITSATPGVTIRYTTNGVAPTASSGAVYSGPLPLNRTTMIRAAAYKTGLLASDVDCHTYIFLADVIQQPNEIAPGPGWPAQKKANGGGQNYDYGMDPDIVASTLWATNLKNDLLAVPTFSIVMNLADFSSIYSNPGGDTIAWERPASIELLYPDDTAGFQANCGIRIRGGFSRSQDNPKHAFRLFFRQEYGVSKLDYPVFGPTGARSFDKFDLRTMQNYSWSFGGDGNMMCLRDVMSRDIQLAMGQPATRGNFYHLYINGVYWGLYNSEERPEAAFAESYVGGRAEDYDVIKQLDGYISGPTDGDTAAWYRLWEAATNGFASDVDYFRVQGLNVDGTPNPAYENLVDVPNLIDYMLVILYGGNLDAPISAFLGNDSPNNWYGFRDRSGLNGGFRFISHDAEHTLLNVNEDRTGLVDGSIGGIHPDWTCGNPLTQAGGAGEARLRSTPQYIWFRMHLNPEFRMLVADRVQKWCFNGGPLSVAGARSMFLARSNELDRAIVGESARWGDAKVGTPYTRNNWLAAMNNVFNNFLGGRTAVLLNQLRADNLFPNISAPLFSSYGGSVASGFALFLTNNNGAGTIYYTVNGADPRARGGNISPAALAYTPGAPLVLNFPTTIRARVRNGTTWSAITEATFYTLQNFSQLLVTEIMYHPPDFGSIPDDDFEFLELKNAGTNTLDFTGLSFTAGINFSFTNGTRLAPGQFFVLARNRGNIFAKYPGLGVHGVFTGRLDNGGELLTLAHALGAEVLSVEYKDSGRWPLTSDGHGFSLVPRNPNASANQGNPSNWRASTNPGGSPGADDPAPTIAGIVINEALTHSEQPMVDFIELHNPTASDVNIGGWFLTDEVAIPGKYRLPDNTVIAAGGYLIFTEADFNPTPGTNNSFSLGSQGEQVYLLSGDANTNLTGYSHGFGFGAAPTGVSFGRHIISTGDERFVAQLAQTPGAANAGPLVGPVVFRQIMYHPIDLAGELDNLEDEYLEIRNITAGAVLLFDAAVPTNTWRLRGGASFDFPRNVTLAAGQSLVLVSFNPTDTARRASFLGKYGTFGSVPLHGPYIGKLDNSSDTVELQRPDQPETNAVPYIIVDRVDYKDAAPWSAAPDGSGAALQRLQLGAFGDDPANWVGAAPLTITALTPSSIAVRAGTSPSTYTNVTFTVSAYGTGDLLYQWRKDGAEMPGATNTSITITNVQLADEAAYSVTVTDLSGAITSPGATLGVLVNPVVIQAPLSQTVVAGGTVTFSAAITGSPPPFTYEWRVPSVGVYTNVSNERTSFYTFTASSIAATQQYRVVVKNLANSSPGVSHSMLATLRILADTDHDGLPDEWETSYGLNPANALDAALDTDGDGMTNGQEYIAGTDPLDPESYLRVSSLTAGGAVSVQFQAISNKTYSVVYKDEFSHPVWLKLADVLARATNRLETVIDSSPGTNRYFKLVTPKQP